MSVHFYELVSDIVIMITCPISKANLEIFVSHITAKQVHSSSVW